MEIKTVLILLIFINSILSNELDKVADIFQDYIGYSDFKANLHKVKICPQSISGQDVTKQIADAIGEHFGKIDKTVRSLKETIEENAYATDYEPSSCCDSSRKVGFENNDVFGANINTDHLCSRHFNNKRITSSEALRVKMKRNFELSSADNGIPLKWQYYGTEKGALLSYPSINTSAPCEFDPRIRPWYKETATPGKFAVIIAIDHSTSACDKILEQEKIATKIILDTLNPTDWVNFIEFASEAYTANVNCFSNKLVKATPVNIETLKDSIDKIDSKNCPQSDYTKAFDTIFELFRKQLLHYPDNIQQENIVLFMTDGKQVPDTLYDHVERLNSALDNSVRIIPYIFSDVADNNNTLCRISRNQRKVGNCTFIMPNEDVRDTIGAYYKFTGTYNTGVDPVVTIPYVDVDALGTVTAVCLPVIYPDSTGTKSLRGIACVDVPINDLHGIISLEMKGSNSYVFVIHESGRVLLHPRLPKLGKHYFSTPTFVDIDILETDHNVKDKVIKRMKQGESGSARVFANYVIDHGDGWMDGNYNTEMDMEYHFRPVTNMKGYSVCFVHVDGEKTYSYEYGPTRANVIISNGLESQVTSMVCKHNGAIAFNGSSAVFLTEDLFLNPRSPKLNNEGYLARIKSYLEGKEVDDAVSKIIKPGVKDLISASGLMDAYWTINAANITSSISFFAGSIGFLRSFPGIELSSKYTFTSERWYKKTMIQKDVLVFTRNTESSFHGRPSVTIGRVVELNNRKSSCQGGSSVVGLFGFEMNVDYFGALVTRTIDVCKNSRWFLLDDSGYIIYHNERVMANTSLRNTHIGAVEPQLEAIVIEYFEEKNCASTTDPKLKHTSWKVNVETKIETGTFSIEAITRTNLFIVFKTYPTADDQRDCSSKGSLCPKDVIDDGKCTVDASSDVPACPSTTARERTTYNTDAKSNTPSCFTLDCRVFTDECSCAALTGCHWCSGACQPLIEKCPVNVIPIAVGVVVALVIAIAVIIIIVCCCKKKRDSHKNVRHISDNIGSEPALDNSTLDQFEDDAFAFSKRESHVTYDKINSRSSSPAVTESARISEPSSVVTAESSNKEIKTTASDLSTHTKSGRSESPTKASSKPSLQGFYLEDNVDSGRESTDQSNPNRTQLTPIPGFSYPDRVRIVTHPESDMHHITNPVSDESFHLPKSTPTELEGPPYYNTQSPREKEGDTQQLHPGYLYVPQYGHPPNCACGFHYIQSATLMHHGSPPVTPEGYPIMMPPAAIPVGAHPRFLSSPNYDPSVNPSPNMITREGNSTIEEQSLKSKSESFRDNKSDNITSRPLDITNSMGGDNHGFVGDETNVTSL